MEGTEPAVAVPLGSATAAGQASRTDARVQRGASIAYRPDVDGLRAVAVLAVVAFHAFPRKLPGGFVGVDVFFVISGFLITSIIGRQCLDGSFSIGDFYARRIKRIFPALVTMLAAVLALGWFALSNGEYSRLGVQALAGAASVSNLLFWSEAGYFDHSGDEKPLLHLWSLGVEEQFYVVWPLLVWAMWQARKHFATAIGVLMLASFALCLYQTSSSPTAAYFSPLTRFWELLAGGVLACAQLGLLGQRISAMSGHPGGRAVATGVANALSLGGLLLILASAVLVNGKSAFPGWWATLPVAGAVMLIQAGPVAWINRHVLSNPVMVWIGLISFPLYLWHWPLLSFAHILHGSTPPRTVLMAMVLAAFVLAALTHLLVERPLKRRGKSPYLVTGLLVGMILVSLAAGAIRASDGAPGRFPGVVDALASYEYDYRADYREGSCFLRSDQRASDFGSCLAVAGEATKPGRSLPTVVLWGDSHAAHLYPGVVHAFGTKNNIAQFTSHGCSPMLGQDIANRKNCREINDHVARWVAKHQPDVVVLAAHWAVQETAPLSRTVSYMKSLPKPPRIVVVGPVPAWDNGLPRMLLSQARRSSAGYSIPERMTSSSQPGAVAADDKLRQQVHGWGVEYVSLLDMLCTAAGCLTKSGSGVDTLMAWDYGHLTRAGSIFVAERLPR